MRSVASNDRKCAGEPHALQEQLAWAESAMCAVVYEENALTECVCVWRSLSAYKLTLLVACFFFISDWDGNIVMGIFCVSYGQGRNFQG